MSSQEEAVPTADGDEQPAEGTTGSGVEANQQPDPHADLDRNELTTLVDELSAENRRLRAEYARAKRVEYRRSALALLVLGTVAVVGAVLLPIARETLLILGATGLFGGALTWYLSPEQFVTTTTAQSVYESVAATGTELRTELGLEETEIYIPVNRGEGTGAPVRVFIPQSAAHELPDEESLRSLFVVSESTDERGVSLRPTASRLVSEFAESLSAGSPASEPAQLGEQLVDALVEQFELADSADLEVDRESQQITVGVDGEIYGAPTEFDHPVASFLGTGMAFGLDRPVSVETTATDDRHVVTCRWES